MCNSLILKIHFTAFLFFTGIVFSSCAQTQKSFPSSEIREKSVSVIKSMKNDFIPDGYYEPIPKMPPKGYKLMSLADGIYFFTTGLYNNLFAVTTDGVLITDPIANKGNLLKQAIAEVTEKPVKIMVYTHSHIDHIGDAHLFVEGVQILAHRETRRLLNRYKDPKRPLPHILFDKSYTLKFGGLRFELLFPAEGHDKGNIMLYIPDRKILMAVDVATPKSVPFKNFSTFDIYGQMVGIQEALKLDWNTYVAGHLYRPGKREEMQEILDYYYASKKANAQALKIVKFKNVMASTRSKDMERIFGEYYEAVSEECYRILQPLWKKRLMGFEAFARGHCDTWTTFHRTHLNP